MLKNKWKKVHIRHLANPLASMRTVHEQDIEIRFASARELWQHDKPDEAEQVLRSVSGHSPTHVEAAFLRAEIARCGGQFTSAAKLILDLCRAREFDCATSQRGARFIQECQRHDLAGQLCDAALDKGNVDAKLLALAGDIARESGDFVRATSFYRRALAAGVNMDESFVLSALAQITHYTNRQHPDFKLLGRLLHDAACSPRSRASAGFSLAKAFADIDDIAASVYNLRQANALVRAVAPWCSATWNRFVQAQRRAQVAHIGVDEFSSFKPIFIVGLPRTGTTLTATLLSGQTGVCDRGEVRVLRFIANHLIEGGHLGHPAAIREAARLYLLHVCQDDAPATWYIDKDPLNFRYLHVVSAMFPQARIIHCRRNRRDTALSLWAQDFGYPEAGFAYAFSDISDFTAGHDELMRLWRRTLPIPIYDLDYEVLIDDPVRTTQQLCNFIGIPSAASACGSTRLCAPITSSSYWQARQPIYSTSVERWRKYVPFVPELATIPENFADLR